MKFVDTHRFSPVAQGIDLPWEDDLFHFAPEEIPTNKKEFEEFIKDNNITCDTGWWEEQKNRCINGYDIPNAIEEGGDYCVDNEDAIWYGDDVFLPEYKLWIKNKTLHITGRYYFYLNFWPIYGLPEGKTVKTIIKPRFLDIDYFFFQRIVRMFNEEKDQSELKGRQQGFDLPDSEPVLTINGWKRNGDLQKGDLVATHKGTFSPIVEIFPQGEKDIYEIELIDGRKVRCGLNHKWKVYGSSWKGEKERVIDTKYLLENPIKHQCNKGKNVGYIYKLPDIEPIPYEEKELPINPYLLGLLIGDGHMNRGIKISSVDEEILSNIKKILGSEYQLNFDKHSDCNYTIGYKGKHTGEMKKRYGLRSIINKFNPLKQELKMLGMLGKNAIDKFIPDIYKYSSVSQREELLRGLMDSDGYISEKGKMEFKTISKKLSEDISELCRSLGIKIKCNKFKSKQGFNDYYRVYLKTNKINPFKLKRKAERFSYKRKIYKRVSIVNVRKLNYKESSSCIMIEDKDHLYLTKDFVPTHNSEKGAGGLLGYNFSFVPNSVNIIVSGEETDAEHTFENVTRGLDALRNTQFYKTRSVNKPSDLIIKAKNFGSEIRGLTAKDKEQVISRYSPFWVFWEEVGKWKKGQCIKAREFALPAQQAEGKKTGFNTFIGTGGDMDQGADDLKTIHYNPEAYNVLEFSNKWERDITAKNRKSGHFSTALAYKIIDKDGNSSLSEGDKYLIEQEKKKKSQKERLKFRTQNPKYASDAFLISAGGFFGEDRIILLNKRYTEVISGTDVAPIEVGRLEPLDASDISKGVKFILDPNGWLKVRERPRLDKDGKTFINLYVQGTDSYDIDETATTNSKGASYVKKKYLPGDGVNNTYVCEYIDRPGIGSGGGKTFYKNCAMISVWYNCLNLIENRNLRIFDWYDNNKVGNHIRKRPELAFASKVNGSGSSLQSRGVDPALKPHFLALLSDNLSDQFIDNLNFENQIMALSKYRYETGSHKYNCDITIATAICEVAAKEDEFTPILASGELSKRSNIKTARFVNQGGQIVRIYA